MMSEHTTSDGIEVEHEVIDSKCNYDQTEGHGNESTHGTDCNHTGTVC